MPNIANPNSLAAWVPTWDRAGKLGVKLYPPGWLRTPSGWRSAFAPKPECADSIDAEAQIGRAVAFLVGERFDLMVTTERTSAGIGVDAYIADGPPLEALRQLCEIALDRREAK